MKTHKVRHIPMSFTAQSSSTSQVDFIPLTFLPVTIITFAHMMSLIVYIHRIRSKGNLRVFIPKKSVTWSTHEMIQIIFSSFSSDYTTSHSYHGDHPVTNIISCVPIYMLHVYNFYDFQMWKSLGFSLFLPLHFFIGEEKKAHVISNNEIQGERRTYRRRAFHRDN